MFDIITIFQFIIPIIMVLCLSIISEHVSPKVAGIVAGYPLGTAVILLFIGIENGNEFAAKSALNSLAGISASLTMLYCYYKSHHLKPKLLVAKSIVCSVIGFAVAGTLLQLIETTPITSALIAITSIAGFSILFNRIENFKVSKKVRLGFSTVLFRGVVAGSVTIGIVSISSTVGTGIAGVLASFPTTLLPLIIITDITYGPKHAHTIIKNFAHGSGCLACYTLSVYLLYNVTDIFSATVACFGIATIYMIFFVVVKNNSKFA